MEVSTAFCISALFYQSLKAIGIDRNGPVFLEFRAERFERATSGFSKKVLLMRIRSHWALNAQKTIFRQSPF